jgi:hypothetical protein
MSVVTVLALLGLGLPPNLSVTEALDWPSCGIGLMASFETTREAS